MNRTIKHIFFTITYVSLFYLTLLSTHGFYTSFLLDSFSKVSYHDDVTLNSRSANNLVLLAFAIVSLYWNNKTFKELKKNTKLAWIAHWAIDLSFIPLSVLTMILYNNSKEGIVNLSSIENMFLMWFFLALKHFLMLFRNRAIVRRQEK